MPETCVSITPVQIGHVVGKGGSTLKGIQERTGAKLEILQDGPQVKITADDEAQVAAAEAEVKKIVENQEHPDYEGPEGARLRKEANELGDKRSKLYDEATKKREAGDHEGANKLVAEGKQAGELMQLRHHAAAEAIAKFNNEDKGKGEAYFDMHGLHEEEAMGMLKVRIAKLTGKPEGTVTAFEVIPGAGHHSAPGAQKLKGATEAYLQEKGYAYEAPNAGTFIVQVPGSGEGVISKPEEGDRKKPKVEEKPAVAPEHKKPEAASKPSEKKPSTKKPVDEKKAKKEKSKGKSCCAVM